MPDSSLPQGLPESFESHHKDLERIRGESTAFLKTRETLSQHLAVVGESLKIFLELSTQYAKQNDDELTVQLLGIRFSFLSVLCASALNHAPSTRFPLSADSYMA